MAARKSPPASASSGKISETDALPRANSSHLAAIVECSDDAILSIDLDGIIQSWNSAAQRLFGYSARKIIGKPIFQLIPHDHWDEERQILRRLRNGERIRRYQTVRVRKDGRPVDISLSISPIRDARGKIIGAAKVLRDVTEERAAQAALRKNEQRIQSIVTAAVDAIITIDERGIIESANPAAEKIFGYKLAEMIGCNVNMLMPEPYRGEHDDYLRDYLRTGTAKIIGIGREVTAMRHDGTTFPISLSVSVVESGGKRMFAGIIHDLNARRQLERQIVEASANEQRRIGQDLHDGLCQDLIGIAFGADHIARMLTSKGVSGEAKLANQLAADVRAAAGQARRLSHGLNPVDIKSGGLAGALQALTEKISDSFRVVCELECPQAPRIIDDTTATHLYRIAQEAVSNSIRHGRADHIWIRLHTTSDTLSLSVRDNGIGLSGRATASTAPHTDAHAGIGLQTMRYRAHIINGVFDLRPHPDGGTVVSCTIRGSFLTDPPAVPRSSGQLPKRKSGKIRGPKQSRSR